MSARVGARLLLRPELWAGLWVATSLVLILVPNATEVALSKAWMWLTALTLSSLFLVVRRSCRPCFAPDWIGHLAVVLPRAERDNWAAEAAAVLAATETVAERRRQSWGYLRALPRTTMTVWALRARDAVRARK